MDDRQQKFDMIVRWVEKRREENLVAKTQSEATQHQIDEIDAELKKIGVETLEQAVALGDKVKAEIDRQLAAIQAAFAGPAVQQVEVPEELRQKKPGEKMSLEQLLYLGAR